MDARLPTSPTTPHSLRSHLEGVSNSMSSFLARWSLASSRSRHKSAPFSRQAAHLQTQHREPLLNTQTLSMLHARAHSGRLMRCELRFDAEQETRCDAQNITDVHPDTSRTDRDFAFSFVISQRYTHNERACSQDAMRVCDCHAQSCSALESSPQAELAAV